MPTESIHINDVLINDSRFALRDFIFDSISEPSCHLNTFCTLGILYPIVVYRDRKGLIHLVDGRKRAEYAKQSDERLIRAMVLPETTPVTDIVSLIHCNRRNDIESSVMNKVQFLCFAISMNVPESWILKVLCGALEFKPHTEFLRECERIFHLPRELRQFCHEKKFSLKQLLNLSYYSPDILSQLIQWNTSLQLTASTLDEIASHLKDYLRATNKRIKDFLAEPEVEDIFESSLSQRDKTEKLRQLLYLKRFPTLSAVNANIRGIIKQLHLPKEIQITWDGTLENKKLDVTLNISDPQKWQPVLDTLASPDVKEAVQSILDEL
ncbi:MAG: hypothetical protein AMK71_00705 [Nitrospira bacterium SG8_35_4]|nr:MAG: hypothetical protein AMK71_00705 [Nitrospira bacterium SG8_35_4]